MPSSESLAVTAEAVSDSLSSGLGSRSLDTFDSTDMLARWGITTGATAAVEAGIPAVKYPLGSGQSLAMEGRLGAFSTSAGKTAVFQFRLRVDSTTPKVMVGLMASGSTEALVTDGVWLEKAASGAGIKLKGRYASGTVKEADVVRTWPTGSFVDVALKLDCWPGGLEAVLELDGVWAASITVSGLESARVLVPCLFVTAQSNVWLNQSALRVA